MNGIEAAKSLREKQGDAVLVFITGIKEAVGNKRMASRFLRGFWMKFLQTRTFHQ